MRNRLSHLLERCLGQKSQRRELWAASLGCLVGSCLIITAIQIYSDTRASTDKTSRASSFVTLNKTVEGGILLNLAQQNKAFSAEEMDRVKQLPGVVDIGGFSRNQFPVTVHIWPAGKVGLGAAARADLFFESIPDRFLDQLPDAWQWEGNQSVVPIMVPKFYLDLWNFGLAPSRSEYPALSPEAASSMPIEIFIGDGPPTRLLGRFVAFSKRINSVLVPATFLEWANSKFGGEETATYYFVWADGTIEGPPLSLGQLRDLNEDETTLVSPIEQPSKKIRLCDALKEGNTPAGPARLIVRLENSNDQEFFKGVESLGYETNREVPQQDWVRKGANLLTFVLTAIGSILSLLSLATFSSSFRLLVLQSGESIRDLILLGFSPTEISRIFIVRFTAIFVPIWAISLSVIYMAKFFLVNYANSYGLFLEAGLGWPTLGGAFIFAALFAWINQRVIRRAVSSFS
jgi:hypothetical protein